METSMSIFAEENPEVDRWYRLEHLECKKMPDTHFDGFRLRLNNVGTECHVLPNNIGWMLVSNKFCDALLAVVPSTALQLIKFPLAQIHPKSKTEYFMLNPLRKISCLDTKLSNFCWANNDTGIKYVDRIHLCILRERYISKEDKIFRLAEYPSYLIIEQDVLNSLVEHDIKDFKATELISNW